VETDKAGASTIDSVEYWVKQYDGSRRDPTDLPKPGRSVSDIAEAVSQLLREDPVKRTLVSVLRMRNFRLRWVPHDLTGSPKAQRVKDSRGLLKALKVDARDNFVNIITRNESWYY
jgi:hypothetical protein